MKYEKLGEMETKLKNEIDEIYQEYIKTNDVDEKEYWEKKHYEKGIELRTIIKIMDMWEA